MKNLRKCQNIAISEAASIGVKFWSYLECKLDASEEQAGCNFSCLFSLQRKYFDILIK